MRRGAWSFSFLASFLKRRELSKKIENWRSGVLAYFIGLRYHKNIEFLQKAMVPICNVS